MNKLYTIEYAICEQCQDISTVAYKATLEELGPRPSYPHSVLAGKWNNRQGEIEHKLFKEHRQPCFTFFSEGGWDGIQLCRTCLTKVLQDLDEWRGNGS